MKYDTQPSRVCINNITKCLFSGKPELKTEVDIVIADVSDLDSLAAMCKQAVIVLSCVGPVSTQDCSTQRPLYTSCIIYDICHKTSGY